MNKDREKKFIEELKDIEVKSKSIKKLIHAFDIIEIVDYEINREPKEILACYELIEY